MKNLGELNLLGKSVLVKIINSFSRIRVYSGYFYPIQYDAEIPDIHPEEISEALISEWIIEKDILWFESDKSIFEKYLNLSLNGRYKIVCIMLSLIQVPEFNFEITPDSEEDLRRIVKFITKKRSLVDSFGKLNENGQEKAVERVEELTYIPKYTKSDSDNLK